MVSVGPGMGEILLDRPWKNNGKSWNRYSRSPFNERVLIQKVSGERVLGRIKMNLGIVRL